MLGDDLPDRGLHPLVPEQLPLPGEGPVHVGQPGRGGRHVRDVQHQAGREMLGQVHPDLKGAGYNFESYILIYIDARTEIGAGFLLLQVILEDKTKTETSIGPLLG